MIEKEKNLLSPITHSNRLQTVKEDMVALDNRNEERRAHPRYPCYENAYFDNPRRNFIGTVRDYSLGGIFIKSKKAIKIDEKISLYLTRLENQGRFTVETARVVRKEPIGFAMQFFTKDAELLESPEKTYVPESEPPSPPTT
jgi:hypothetical protein